MSLSEIRNVVLLFSNPVWSGASTVPTTIIRNITAKSSQLAYQDSIFENLTTLTTSNADTLNGLIQGLVYVPDVRSVAPCQVNQYNFIPHNVTRQSNLPPTNYNLIALAPWFNQDCTTAYLRAAARDPVRAFIFYKPNNSTSKPQDANSPVWDLDDNGAWKKENKFPIFAIPGLEGQKMMEKLSLYSGPVEDVPHGEEIMRLYGPNPKDYVRIWTELTLESDDNMPPLWVFFLIIIGALLFIFAAVSCIMHLFQRRRRKSLERRVRSGEVDLEAMGVKRITVPASHVASFPLYTYTSEPAAATRLSGNSLPVAAAASPRSVRSSNRSRRPTLKSTASDTITQNSIRSKRSSLAVGSGDNTATNDQPGCQICLVDFEHRSTIIRNLPCDHIFHPECIDEFLTQISSLCPICKHCMLPRGYSPKITDGMVRRERALRRLRERVNLDDTSLDSSESSIKAWSKRLFSSATSPSNQPELPMMPVASRRPMTNSSNRSTQAPEPAPDHTSTPAPVKTARSRRTQPKPLRVLPTHPEDAEMKEAPHGGRGSPSSFARERMRAIAARNAPFEDPDQSYPMWRRAFGKVFPGVF